MNESDHQSAAPHLPRRIAVIGGGPAGFFAVTELFRSGAKVAVDLFEQVWAPFGLLRYGVAPDHGHTRSVSRAFMRWFDHPDFRYFGNVMAGRDVAMKELVRHYDAVLVATGAELDRRLAIPGADLPGCHTSLEFVGWYNGHPDHAARNFPLDCETVVIVGNGNVAIDVARILSKDPDLLATTDIARRALTTLRESSVRTIYIVGRRGLAQTSFSYNEVHELADLEGVEVDLDPADLDFSDADRAFVETSPDALVRGAVIEGFRELAARPRPKLVRRRIIFRFNRSPVAFAGAGRVEEVRFAVTGGRVAAGVTEDMVPCGLVIKSIGHRGAPLPGLPFDEERHVIPCRDGRVVEGGIPLRPFYAVGWIERGSRGLIGNNKPDAKLVVGSLLADLPDLPVREIQDHGTLPRQLAQDGVRVVTADDWKRLSTEENRRGERFVGRDEALAFLDSGQQPGPF